MPSYTLPGGTIKFESTKVNGRYPAVGASGGGGGSNTFGTSALGGSYDTLADGQELTLTTDGSEGWDFGAGPSQASALGFGQGWLYSNTAGTNLPSSFTDNLYSSTWQRIFDVGEEHFRQVADDLGRKWVYSSGINRGSLNAGLLYFDYGAEIPANTPILVSCINKNQFAAVNWAREFFEIASVDSDSQMTLVNAFQESSGDFFQTRNDAPAVVTTDTENDSGLVADRYTGGLRAEFLEGSTIVNKAADSSIGFSGFSAGMYIGVQSSSQWKHVRFQEAVPNLDNENDFYVKRNQGEATGYANGEGAAIIYTPSGSITKYGGESPMLDYPNPQRIDYLVNPGSVDGSGIIKSRSIAPNENNGIIESKYLDGTEGVSLYDSAGASRWKIITWQDYTDWANDGESWTTDFLVQIGTWARFEIADSDNPSTTTESYILPHKTWASGQTTVHLWKGLFADYSGKYIHFYDDDNVFRKAAAL